MTYSATRSRWTRPTGLGGLVLALSMALLFVAPADADAGTRDKSVSVRVISFNDLHGNLQPPAGSSGRVPLSAPVPPAVDPPTVDAGGAAYLATHVKQLKAGHKHSFVVAAGDLIGGSPLISAAFHDEPTIDVMNAIGLKASAVGNHEFDEGYQELIRIQTGGCHPNDKCQFRDPYEGADFPYLGANVTRKNGQPALLPFTVRWEDGIPIGIIGVTLQDLPDVVVASGISNLEFGEEVQAINRTANLLDRFGVKAQIVLMHQGDESLGGGPNDCNVEEGVAANIAKTASPKVDAFFAAHTHQQYNCTVRDPAGHRRPIIQGLSFGRLLSVVDLKLSRKTRDVIRSKTVAHNEIVTRDVTPDPEVQAIIDEAKTKSAPIANRPVGTITAALTRAAGPSGESPLGDVIADAQLAATQANNAQIAITNPGGIRTDLEFDPSGNEGPGVVTYEEAFGVQPFSNIMQTITLTGAQLDAVLEQQWQPQKDGTTIIRILQISASLHYTQTLSAPIGSRVSNLTLNGDPIDPAGSYRVSVNNFLAGGGDGFTVFTQGTDLTGGPIDLDAFVAYLTAHPNLAPPPADRITVVP